jgi:hypothetical protein
VCEHTKYQQIPHSHKIKLKLPSNNEKLKTEYILQVNEINASEKGHNGHTVDFSLKMLKKTKINQVRYAGLQQ